MADLGRIFKENPVNPGYCLVLRPMGGEYDRVWTEIRRTLKATFEWNDVGALTGAGAIMEEVVREIARTDAVIVDVSEARPNVFYELGIAHVMKGVNKVVLVKQSSSNVPFDVQAYRHLDYEPTPEGLASLLPELERRVRQALEPTSWFRIAEGGTYHSDPLMADEKFYTFELQAKAFAGQAQYRNEAVRIAIAVHGYPDSTAAADKLEKTLAGGETCQVPGLPWRVKFEYFEEVEGSRQAVICVIPDVAT